MTTEITVEIVATVLEIASFFFVTTDLFGRAEVERAAKGIKDRTRKRFDDFVKQFSGAAPFRSAVLAIVATLAACLLFAVIAVSSVGEFRLKLATPFIHATDVAGGVIYRPDTFWEFMGGHAHDTVLQATFIYLKIIVLGALCLLAGTALLVGTLVTLFLLSVLVYFAISKILFWRSAPERGLLMVGAALFILSKLISVTSKILLASH
jgi:hypothetical protein